MTKKNVPKVPPRPLDLPSAISPYEKESSEAEAKLRDTATTKREDVHLPRK
jgi:hypothetical protein